MKQLLLTAALFFTGFMTIGQNINDQRITFNYIQLPLLKIDAQFDHYSVKVEHAYERANADSMLMFDARKNVALEMFQQASKRYYRERDSLDRIHLSELSSWEKRVNAGLTNPDGTPLTKPVAPIYPQPPVMEQVETPILHAAIEENLVSNRVQLSGFNQGDGQVEITITIHPLRSYRIVRTKKGTGANTKYRYEAKYVMPIGLRVTTPAQGTMMETTLFEEEMTYNMPTQDSKYDHELYMMDNKETVFRQLENHSRQNVLARVNDHLNNHFGFVERSRTAELYSVRSFKDHDYTDVTNAFTKTSLALQAVGEDRDRSSAMSKINAAISATEAILAEANLSDRKARINDKITAMLQCNLAELYMWKADFNRTEGLTHLILNSGEGKAKRHIRGEENFYKDQRNRWDVHF